MPSFVALCGNRPSGRQKRDGVGACVVSTRTTSTRKAFLEEHLQSHPEDVDALQLAADIALQLGQPIQAVKHLQSAVAISEQPSVKLLDELGRLWMTAGRPFEAVAVLESAVAQHPEEPSLRRDLGGLQASLGMELQAAEHLQWLVQRNHCNPNVLIMLSDLSRPQTDEQTCKHALAAHPQDLRPQFSLARVKAYQSKWNAVATELEPVIRRHQEFAIAHAYYIRAWWRLKTSQRLINGSSRDRRTWRIFLSTGWPPAFGRKNTISRSRQCVLTGKRPSETRITASHFPDLPRAWPSLATAMIQKSFLGELGT